MFKNLSFLFLCAIFVAAGCSSDLNIDSVMEASDDVYCARDTKISLNEALGYAEEVINKVEEQETRGMRIIDEIEYRGSHSIPTRAEADTMLYLVNYADNKGYALLSADRRIPAVLAFNNEGSLHFSDTIDNPGLALFMRNVDAALTILPSDPDPDKPANPPTINYRDYLDDYTIIRPKLSPEMCLLNQTAPFNKYCPVKNGVQSAAGCAATAMTMLLSFYKWPENYGGYDFNWYEMQIDTNHDSIYRLIALLGNPELLNLKYFYKGTTSAGLEEAWRYEEALKNLGYDVKEPLADFNPKKVFDVLRKGEYTRYKIGTPVLVRGNLSPNKDGHAWVVDGGLELKPAEIIDGRPIYSSDPMYYFHCVWGWSGKNNGYFSFDNSTLGGIPDMLDPDDTYTPNLHYNFTANLQFIGIMDINR